MRYENKALREIVFPLGGIGTGSIGYAGNGRFMDWEIRNRPDKGSANGYTHLAIRCRDRAGRVYARVLQGDYPGSRMGQYDKGEHHGYGFGPAGTTMCGFPHFRSCVFTGSFPLCHIDLADDDFPADVRVTAYNPMIPLDADNSSLPAALFTVAITNTGRESMAFDTAFSLRNLFSGARNGAVRTDTASDALCLVGGAPHDSPAYGEMCLTCAAEDTYCQSHWYRGGWQDPIVTFWNEWSSGERLCDRCYPDPYDGDTGTVVGSVEIAPGETREVRFTLTWYVPICYNYWSPCRDADGRDVTWRNHYATRFSSAADVNRYVRANGEALYRRTMAFHDALHGTSLPENVVNRASANLSVLKSPTVLRLEDGSFWGWEGLHEKSGSCEGTCQHVWNYAYAMCYLFPGLERSIRELELTYGTYPTGETDFRMKLPLGRKKGKFRACVDGQMGTVLKIYRDWKLTGNTDWLRAHWDTVKKLIEYAWSPDNADAWDRDRDGVLEGRQHHTLDMELFGPSSWLEGFYLGALKAGAEMADALGDTEAAAEYRTLFESGYRYTKEKLFNGKYFLQNVDLHDRALLERFGAEAYWNAETGEMKYQIGEGSSIDQLCAQWHADLSGLGALFDPEETHTALENLYRNNFKPSMRGIVNPWRIFSLDDEGGAQICVYPDGACKPRIPVPYCEETMTGFEYQLAGLLVGNGFVREGFSIVDALEKRFDGVWRNPFNEFECGSNYARSMASFALLPLCAAMTVDLPRGTIGFDPVLPTLPYTTLWSVGTGWGTFTKAADHSALRITEGSVTIQRIGLPYLRRVSDVTVDGLPAAHTFDGRAITFDRPVCIRDSLIVAGENAR